jgi:hypothetical protein
MQCTSAVSIERMSREVLLSAWRCTCYRMACDATRGPGASIFSMKLLVVVMKSSQVYMLPGLHVLLR